MTTFTSLVVRKDSDWEARHGARYPQPEATNTVTAVRVRTSTKCTRKQSSIPNNLLLPQAPHESSAIDSATNNLLQCFPRKLELVRLVCQRWQASLVKCLGTV